MLSPDSESKLPSIMAERIASRPANAPQKDRLAIAHPWQPRVAKAPAS